MSKRRRTLGISILILLAALGTGWTLEKAPNRGPAQGDPAVSDSTTTIAPLPAAPASTPAPAADSSEEYDRSDLFLSQG